MSEFDQAQQALAVVDQLVLNQPEVGAWIEVDPEHLGIVLQLFVELAQALAARIAADDGESVAGVLRLYLDLFNAAMTANEATTTLP